MHLYDSSCDITMLSLDIELNQSHVIISYVTPTAAPGSESQNNHDIPRLLCLCTLEISRESLHSNSALNSSRIFPVNDYHRETMRSTTALLALLSGNCIIGSSGFAPPSPLLIVRTATATVPQYCPAAVGSSSSSTKLHSTPEPLAEEGDWSAYLDAETTGYVYYFNSVTGESIWEPPTSTFPTTVVIASSSTPTTTTISREEKKEDRRAEREQRREERKVEREESSSSGGGGGGFFGALFGGKEADSEPTKSKTEQLSELSEIANNDNFLSELDLVIAEAEEAIAIAEKVEEAPPKNMGGFFSSLGFISGKEAIEEAEILIANVEERTSKVKEASSATSTSPPNILSGFSFGARASPKKLETKEAAPAEETPDEPAEENLFVEGLMNLFQRSFDAFIPPQTKTTAERKVVAVDETPKEKKAEVSDSDFLDVIWGAETSARPTLNIAEMMKAFQVQSEEEPSTTTKKVSAEFKTLALDMAFQVKAHPEKVSWGGEDAGFSVGRTFGVFDGVSGAEKEKGKKLYSRSLADSMKKSSGKGGLSVKELTDNMLEAKNSADGVATGASTAVVGSIGEDNVLRALNLGDSVCLVLRDGAVAARTREIIQ